jgi:lipopolysaccharide transport system permease protein
MTNGVQELSAPDKTESESEEQWDFIIAPKRSLLSFNLGEVWHYRDLLFLFVHRDIVTVYKQTILGPIWYLVQPIMTTAVYIFVFSRIAQISTDEVPPILFYLSGIVTWNYFANVFGKTCNSFVVNAPIYSKVYFPRIIIPLSLLVSEVIRFAIQFALFLSVLVFYLLSTDAVSPTAGVLAFPFVVALMGILGLGFGLISSGLTTKYRDLTFLQGFVVQLAMYATPVIYPMSLLGDRARGILWWNPIAHLIELAKFGFLGAGTVSIGGLAYSVSFTGLVLLIGLIVFNYTERSFVDTV